VEPLHPTANPPEIERFDEFDLHETVQAAIAEMNIVKPTPIQALAINPVLEGRDVIAKAETGTGKTLAFGAPMISKIDSDRVTVLGLVLCPTRELAEQVAVVLEKLGEPRDIKVALIVGGEPAGPQVAALHAGAQVVVGTPGRVIDLYQQKFLSFPWTEFVVLDEADEMLEIGFIDDVKKILSFTPDERQTLLFSATFPDTLLRLARDSTRDPAEIATASGVKTVDSIVQEYVAVDESERPLALIRMIERSDPDDVFLVFCERRTEVERLMRRLERLPFPIKALHGGYDQAARFRVMGAFRTGDVKVLVATDVASRGLDVKHVSHVVNYAVPRSITDYTHRIGRTGRAGREGHAVTLVTHDHMHRWKILLRDATWEIRQVDAPGPQRRDRGRDRQRGESDRDERRGERREGRGSERPERRRRDRDRERPAREARRPEREERGREDRAEEPTERPRRERSRGSEAEPVRLPSGRPKRRRDPGDPPRRTRLAEGRRDEQESREAEPDSPRREGGEERGRSRSRGQDRQGSRGQDRQESRGQGRRGSRGGRSRPDQVESTTQEDGEAASGRRGRPRRERQSSSERQTTPERQHTPEAGRGRADGGGESRSTGFGSGV